MLAVILFLATQSPADNDDRWEQLKVRIEAAPQNVATFIERRVGCNYWDGEVSGGRDGRERLIQTKRAKLRCDSLDRDERTLRKEHRNSGAVQKLLDDTKEMAPW